MSTTEPKSKLVLHYLTHSRSQRILWLLEELGVPYDLKKYERTPEQVAPQELAEVHPFGISPIIVDEGITLIESGAIVEYLISKYGQGRFQPSEAGHLDNLFYSHYTEGTLMPLLVNLYIYNLIPQQVPWILRPVFRFVFGALSSKMIEPRLIIHANYIEDHLKKSGKWLAGGEEPTSADFMMSIALEGWVSDRANELGENMLAYVKRIHERPAYQRALEKGGPYAYASLSG